MATAARRTVTRTGYSAARGLRIRVLSLEAVGYPGEAPL